MNANVTKTNGVKLLAVVAVLAMVVCAFAAVMPAEETDAAKDPTYIHGGITSFQDFGAETEVIIDGDLTIPANTGLQIAGKFTVNEGVTVTIQAGGFLIINDGAKATIDGNIVATGVNTVDPTTIINKASSGADTQAEGDEETTTVYPSIVNKVSDNTKDKYLTVNGSITLEKGAIMSNSTDAVAKSDSSSDTDANNGMVLLSNGASLNVTKRSNDISIIENQNILLNEGATFSLNGQVGNVYVQSTGNATYRTEAAVSINAGGLIDYTAMERTTSNLTFTVVNQSVSALTFNYGDENYTGTTYTVRQYILNVDGEVAATDKLATVATGTNVKSASYVQDATCQFFYPNENENANVNMVMPAVSVSGNLTIAANSTLTVTSGTYLDISGILNLSYSKSDTAAATAAFNGAVHVTGTIIGTNLTGNNISSSPAVASDIIYVESGSIQITEEETLDLSKFRLWGTSYTVDGATTNVDPVLYIMNFADAIEAATAAEAGEVNVYAFGAQNRTTADSAALNGAYVIETEVTIPADMDLVINNALVVGENGKLVLEDGATVTISKPGKNNAVLWNNGKVVDYGGAMEDSEAIPTENNFHNPVSEASPNDKRALFVFEVKKITETDTEYYVTYTSLAIAIDEAQPGETIELNGKVTITQDITIPADVTVVTDDDVNGEALEIKGATLTIAGTLEISVDGQTVKVSDNTDNNRKGAVVLNNIIANADETTFGAYTVSGAYYQAKLGEDTSSRDYITTVALAAENSAIVEGQDGITIRGAVAAGTVTFTEGENNVLTVNIAGTVSSGNITLVGADLNVTGTITGTVTSDVTAGTSTVEFTKASGVKISIGSADDGETVTTTMVLNGELSGIATITAGAVDAGSSLSVKKYTDDVKSVLTVGAGATLNVPKNAVISTNDNGLADDKEYAGLVIDGTLAIGEGTFTNNGIAAVAGTMTIDGSNPTLGGTLNVTGTLTVAEDNTLQVTTMYVGDADGAAGTITGVIKLNTTSGFLVAYPAANIDGAAIDENEEGNTTDNVTAYYVNGEVIMTSYAVDGVALSAIIPAEFKLTGYETIKFGETSNWYDNPEMDGTAISSKDANSIVQNYEAVYAEAKLMNAAVKLSIGPGMSVFIDDVRYDSDVISLAVGEHTIVVQVNPGYAGTATVTLGGAAVTDGKFTITPEMAEEYTYSTGATDGIVLSVMGDISYDTGSTGDSGMGLTEILLVILVVLIVIMAIMVALRLMRS